MASKRFPFRFGRQTRSSPKDPPSSLNDALPKDAIVLSGHTGMLRRIVPLPDGERVVTASSDNTLRLFSVGSGKCLNTYKGHSGFVNDAALLSDDTMVSVSGDKTARLWRVSDATLMHTVTFEVFAWSVAALGDGRFVVGLTSGDLCELQSYSNTAPILLKTVTSDHGSHSDLVDDISVCGGRFATASGDKTAKVWDSVKLQCLATLSDHSDWVRSVALSDNIVASGSHDTIRVYDANTYQFLRVIATHFWVYSVRLVGKDQNILSSTLGGLVAVHNTIGELVWSIDLRRPAPSRCCTTLATGHIAIGFDNDAVVYNLPPDIVSQISESSQATALQLALSTCLSGDSSAVDHCNELITYTACRVSLEEWHSAHQILMLAVNNNDILQSTEHKDKRCWWFEQLYLAIIDIHIPSDEDLNAVKRCLREAKELGLIDSIDTVLGALHVTKAFEQDIRALHRAGILIFQRVFQLEGRVLELEERIEGLVKSFDSYRVKQMYSQLIGIALQLIPIAGGAEIVHGLSIKDMVDYFFGLGSNLAEGRIESFGDRALRRAADVLSPEELWKMDVAGRKRLEQAVEACGLRVEELREMFAEKVIREEGGGSSEVEVRDVTTEDIPLDATECARDRVIVASSEHSTGETAEVEVSKDEIVRSDVCGSSGVDASLSTGSFVRLMRQLMADHDIELSDADIDLLGRLEDIELFKYNDCDSQFKSAGVCVEIPKGTPIPEASSDAVMFRYGPEERLVVVEPKRLTALGFSVVSWIFLPGDRDVLPFLKMMVEVSFRNCLVELITGERKADFEKKSVVVPMGWLYWLDVQDDFLLEHGDYGDMAAILGNITDSRSPGEGAGRLTAPANRARGILLTTREIVSFTSGGRRYDIRTKSSSRAENNFSGCRKVGRTKEYLYLDEDFRLVYCREPCRLFKPSAVNANAAGFGVGGTREQTPGSVEHEKRLVAALFVRFECLSQFVTLHLKRPPQCSLMKRMKWLQEVLECKAVFPSGINRMFLRATTGDTHMNPEEEIFPRRRNKTGTTCVSEPDCRIDRYALLKRHRVELDLCSNPNKIFFIDDVDANEIYAATFGPRGPDMYIIHGCVKASMPKNTVLLNKDLG